MYVSFFILYIYIGLDFWLAVFFVGLGSDIGVGLEFSLVGGGWVVIVGVVVGSGAFA